MERALKASGRTIDGKPAPKDEPDEEAEPDADDKEPAEAKEPDKDAPKRIALDKIKNGAHVRKAKDQLKTERDDLDKRERAHKDKMAEDARINAAADREYGDMATAAVAYKAKDYRTTGAALKKLLGDDLSTVMRNVYNATKDGMGVADLQHEVKELKALLLAKTDGDSKKEEATNESAEEKRERGNFDKRVKSHGLTEVQDSELNDEAFKLYYDSWDDQLEEYALTPKAAADKVLAKEQRRAERLTGRRIVPRETPRREPRETRETTDKDTAKPYADMSKDERRKWALDMALRKTEKSKRAREREL